MTQAYLQSSKTSKTLLLKFSGECSVYTIDSLEKQINTLSLVGIQKIDIDMSSLSRIDTSAALFIDILEKRFISEGIDVSILTQSDAIKATFALVKKHKKSLKTSAEKKKNAIKTLGLYVHQHYEGLLAFLHFLGNLFATKLYYLRSFKNIRIKEIAFEIHESGIKAILIIAITSFLIGLVVAYQSAHQLKIYGANIFIVDMLGISILRELAPLITAIVIAGRSGSAFTAQIGAMKITQELDAMRTMGFDPFVFLVMPRIIALMIVMPLLIFLADMMGILGGILVANIDLHISPSLFLDRFLTAVDIKHFYIGIIKGPFFAFLIASIGIYRGLGVKDDTQSIGFNTTKSVVASIFAVIVCDALFSIAFTNLGI